jgi:hypothetical protein
MKKTTKSPRRSKASFVDMEWLVSERNNLQNELVRLRKLIDSSSANDSAIYLNWLAGVGFSLWRAVFQVRMGLRSGAYVENSIKLLNTVIFDNSALYRDELNSWSLGYYLGSARLRLWVLSENIWINPNEKIKRAARKAAAPMISFAGQQNKKRDAQQEWIDCFTCMKIMLDEVQKNRNVKAKGPKKLRKP